jgi:hypothetical protein
MKKSALSIAISILLFSTSSVVLSDNSINVGVSQHESQLQLKKLINLKQLKLTKDEIKKISKEKLATLKPHVLSFFDDKSIKHIPAAAFEAINVEQFSKIDFEGLKGLTLAQFDKIPSKVLKGLEAKNLGYLRDDIFEAFNLEDVLELKEDLFKKANTKDLSKLLVNIGKKYSEKGEKEKIRPEDLRRFLPEGWAIKDNGELIVPEGTDLALPAILNPQKLLAGITFPRISNLKKGLGMNGVGNSFLKGMNGALKKADLGQYVIEQDDEGILHIKDSRPESHFDLAFMPDSHHMKQAKKGQAAGLSKNKRGFFILTTDDGREVSIIPAPKDLKKILGLEKAELGEAGDVLIQEIKDNTFSIGLFDPFLTVADKKLTAGVHFPEDSSGRKPATVVYEDGTSQLMYPTIYRPAAFFKEAKKIEGVEEIKLNADGTLFVQFKGQKFQLEPTFKVSETELPNSDEKIEPKIEIKPDGTIDYTIQNEQAILTMPLNIKIDD